jgi:hypothetical protein
MLGRSRLENPSFPLSPSSYHPGCQITYKKYPNLSRTQLHYHDNLYGKTFHLALTYLGPEIIGFIPIATHTWLWRWLLHRWLDYLAISYDDSTGIEIKSFKFEFDCSPGDLTGSSASKTTINHPSHWVRLTFRACLQRGDLYYLQSKLLIRMCFGPI